MKAIIRKDVQAVSPVIATILMVAITVVLAAVLYVMVSGLISGPTTTKPVVTFGSLSVTSASAQFQVAGATPIVAITSYKFNLQVNGTTATTAVSLAAGSNSIQVGAITYTVTYTDISGNGNLKPGDIIKVTPPTGRALTGNYLFILLWASDGSSIQTQAWSA